MEKLKGYIKSNGVNIIISVLYLFTVTITMLHHELWRDEAQAWCIVRDCGLFEIFERSRAEGHPVLWYLLLIPFAKTGMSVFSMQITGLLFGASAVLYMIFKFPFNAYTKFVTAFSSALLYFLPVVVRNYAMIPLFVFLLAELYQKRNERPWLYSVLIILLANTHILIEGFAFILFVLFAVEQIQNFMKDKKRKCLYPLIPLVLNFLLIFLWFVNAASNNYAVSFYSENFHKSVPLGTAITVFSGMFFLFPFSLFGKINFIFFYAVMSIFIVSLFFKDKKVFGIMSFSFLYHFYVFYCVWFGGIQCQKAFVLLVIMIFCYRVCYEKRDKLLTVVFCLLFTVNSLFSIFNVMYEINGNFSASEQTADFIKNNLKDEKIFYTSKSAFMFSPISAYLPDVKLYCIKSKKYVTYYDFKLQKYKTPMPEALYLITSSDENEIPDTEKYKEIFSSDNNVISGTSQREVFKIYRKIND